jgi:hypothetical protein
MDIDGETFAFYRLDGVPVPAPTGGDVICSNCGAANVAVILVARRDSPPARLDSDEPGSGSPRPRPSAVTPPRTCQPSFPARSPAKERRADLAQALDHLVHDGRQGVGHRLGVLQHGPLTVPEMGRPARRHDAAVPQTRRA